MAEYKDKIIDKRFHNWIKAALGVSISKEGIGEIVTNEITKFHTNILTEILSPEQILQKFVCTACTKESILTCPTKGICVVKSGTCSFHKDPLTKLSSCPNMCCDKLRDKIKQYHKYNCPSWKNTRVEYWFQNPWELAKCYMPPDGYSCSTSSYDTDLNGIISVMMNFTMLCRKIDEIACAEAREVGKRVRHSANLHLSDRIVITFLDTLNDFLASFDVTKTSVNVQEAITLIKKLKKDEITISTKDIEKLLRSETTEMTGNDDEMKKASKIDVLEKAKETYEIKESKGPMQSATLQRDTTVAGNEKMDTTSNACYELLKKNLKSDLLTFNKINNSSIPLSPIFEEYDAPLLHFYVPPIVRLVGDEIPGHGTKVDTDSLALRSYHDIFHSKIKECRNIYLTSAAGLGKTTFTRKITLTWCFSHDFKSKGTKDFLEDDLESMKEFEMLFLISLRDSSNSECEIDSMIYHQIIPNLSRSFLYTMNFLQEVLHKETCLIILDGLDEWSHPSKEKSDCRKSDAIPHRKFRERCTVLTTTRPWKLDVVNLKCSQIDRHVELLGFDSKSSDKMIENVLNHLNTRMLFDVRETVKRFNEEVRKVDIEELKNIPLILMHLIGLWSDGNCLGRSRLEIYTNITEMLLSRAQQKCEDIGIILPEDGNLTTGENCLTMFDFVKEKHYCSKYRNLLRVLSQMAFKALFNISDAQCLVFTPETVEKHMKEQEIYFFYKTGLLTRSLFRQQFTKRISTISFAHKTFQEYFASLYIGLLPNSSAELKDISSRCRTVESIVETANVFVFECGIARERASLISQQLYQNVETTPLTLKYRSNACFLNYWKHLSVMKSLQDMYVDCMHENDNNTDVSIRLHLADFLIDGRCRESKYRTALVELMQQNTTHAKSVHINGFNDPREIGDLMTVFGISKIGCLQRLDIWGKVDQEDLNSALEASAENLKYILIHSGEWINNRWIEQYIPFSDKTLAVIQRIQNLTTISLWTIALTHTQLEKFMAYLSKGVFIQQIGFGAIKCIDHSDNCPGVYLDLRNHSDLQILHLNKIPLSNVTINTSTLEECHIGEFPTDGLLSSILDCLPDAQNLHTFGCYYMTSESDVEKMVLAISNLSNLKNISFILVNMGNQSLELSSKMKQVDNIKLKRVTMCSSAMNKLIASAELLHQSVRIDIMNCIITPEEEFAKIKRDIRTSDRFVVNEEGIDHRKRKMFSFSTKPT